MNESGASIEAVVIWRDTYEGKTTRRTEDYTLGSGDEKQGVVWFYEAPPKFTVRVRSGGREWERTISAAEYPRTLQAHSSMGPTTRMIVRDREIVFADGQ